MERGHLDDVHPDVVQVRYVGKFTPPRVEGDPTRGTIETEDDGIGAWPWILLGVGLATARGSGTSAYVQRNLAY